LLPKTKMEAILHRQDNSYR